MEARKVFAKLHKLYGGCINGKNLRGRMSFVHLTNAE